jgi:hypothetical protein
MRHDEREALARGNTLFLQNELSPIMKEETTFAKNTFFAKQIQANS